MRSLKLMFTLALGSALLAGTATAADQSPVVDDQEIVCKKTLETGSLVKKTKQCFTKAEWARIAESQRTGAQKLIHDLTTKKGDNN